MKPVSAERIERITQALNAASIPCSQTPETLALFSNDEAGLSPVLPQLVVFARSTEDVQQVLHLANQHTVPVTPVGARTGKSGGSIPAHRGIALSLERMNQIIEIRRDDFVAVVEPGVRLGDFARAVEAQGLFYPPDPNSVDTCTLGGNVAENAGGPRAVKYGVTRDYVIGLEWVLPTGEVLTIGRQTHKGVVGYDLVGLFVGSEGTLGIATKIWVRLLPLPRSVQTAFLPYTSMQAALTDATSFLQAGVLPRAMEFLDDTALDAVRESVAFVPPEARAALVLEVDGSNDESTLRDLQQVVAALHATDALPALVAQSEQQRAAIWNLRRTVSPALRRVRGRKFSEDIVVPRSHIGTAVNDFKQIGHELGLGIATYGHAGDGNLHTNVLFSSDAELPRVNDALSLIMKRTVELGGTMSGEHGIGLSKKAFLSMEQSAPVIHFQKQLKVMCDPAIVLNPGKMFPDQEE